MNRKHSPCEVRSELPEEAAPTLASRNSTFLLHPFVLSSLRPHPHQGQRLSETAGASEPDIWGGVAGFTHQLPARRARLSHRQKKQLSPGFQQDAAHHACPIVLSLVLFFRCCSPDGARGTGQEVSASLWTRAPWKGRESWNTAPGLLGRAGPARALKTADVSVVRGPCLVFVTYL